MPGLCLLDIGGSPCISYNMTPLEATFHIFNFFSETTNRWHFILCQNMPDSSFVFPFTGKKPKKKKSDVYRQRQKKCFAALMEEEV